MTVPTMPKGMNQFETTMRVSMIRPMTRSGMTDAEARRLNHFYHALINMKYAHENAVKAVRQLPVQDLLAKPQYFELVESHYEAGDKIVSLLSEWAVSANKMDHQPGPAELADMRGNIKALEDEHRFYLVYYNKFRFMEDISNAYMQTGEAIAQAQITREKVMEIIRMLEDDTY